ncbi:MAG: PD-(D/E)XK nuclease family protein [Fusobacteria bacterium]|nr:PD-(D/E)XK nuclease family protein [Fusobacteriota bacterium]
MVELILGRRRSGKSYQLIKSMKEHISQGEICYYLVPEQSTLENEYQLIKEMEIISQSENKGLIDIQVVSFTKLAGIILKKTEVRNMKLLSEVGQQIILRKAIDDLELTIFKNPKEKELDELLKLISQIREIKDLEAKISNINEAKLKAKLNEINMIKNQYLKYIDNEHVDKITYLDFLLEKIKEDKQIASSNFYIDDFNNLTIKQLEILKAIIFKAKKVKIAFNLDLKQKNFFEPTTGIYEEIISFLTEYKIPYKTSILENQYYGSTELKLLENKLSDFKARPLEEELKDIKIRKTTNIDDEVKLLFETIVDLVDQDKVNYDDIKVICNNIEDYRHYLKLYRKLYQVPLFIDEKLNLHNHPIVRVVLNLLLLKEGYYTEGILELLKTGYLPFSYQETELLESYVKAYGINTYKWLNTFKYNEEAEEIRQRLIALIDDIRRTIKGQTVKELIAGLYQTMIDLTVYEELVDKIEKFKEAENFNNVYYYTQAWNSLLEVFDQLAGFIGNKKIDCFQLHKLLKESLSLINISLLPLKSQEVLVINSKGAGKEKCQVAFLLGFNEGNYPLNVESDPIFPLEQEEYLERTLNWSRSKEQERWMRSLEAYNALTMASDKLYLSVYEIDSKGDPIKPAYILKQIKRKFPKLSYELIEPENKSPYISLDKLLIALLIEISKTGVISEKSYKFLALKDRTLIDNLVSLSGAEEGQIKREIVKEIIFKRDIPVFSISKLESYGSCPYSYYVKNILRPKDIKEYSLGNIDLGNILHHLLEKIGKACDFELDDNKKIQSLVADAFEEIMIEGQYQSYDTGYFLYQLQRIKDNGQNIVEIMLSSLKNDSFNPKFYELDFGINKSLPPFQINLAGGKMIELEGKIDRLDVCSVGNKNYLKIIDYKLSEKDIELKRVIDGISFQLFIYLESQLNNKENIYSGEVLPGGLHYSTLLDEINFEGDASKKANKGFLLENQDITFYYDKNYSNLKVISQNAYQQICKRIYSKISEYVKGMEIGDFKVNPYYYENNNNACQYCNYYKLCGNKKKFRYCKKINNKTILERLEGKDDQLDQGTAGNN